MARPVAGNLSRREGRALSGTGPGRDEEPIVPAAIEFTPAATEPSGRSPRPLIATALGLCVLLVLGVIFLLPKLVAPDTAPATDTTPPTDTAPTPAEPSPAEPAAAAASEEPAPAADLAARRAAQDALARLQPLRAELVAAAVPRWAPEPFAAAQARIDAGDAAYRALRYAEALIAYEEAQQQLDALRARIAPHVEALLAAGSEALAAGDAGAAERAFQQVVDIQPDQPAARAGLARAATLPDVRARTAEGQRRLDSGDLDAAADLFAQALALDGADPAARAGAARVAELRTAQRHQAALDAGFAALQSGDHEAAIRAFERALAARPGSSSARTGLAEARRRATAARIDALFTAARQAEAAEDWSAAADRYGEALALEANLPAARTGQTQATTRARLDAALRATLATPQRLSARDVQSAANGLLDQARAVADPGPRLGEQIAALETALAKARIPIAVELQSDQHTEVTLLWVGSLGSFASKRLELLPGDYVALGERVGYRDVRVTFSVHPDLPPPTVRVACTEPI